ncbi:MAG: RNA methyltransferase [Ignavibacteria bacterium]|nr:RNA methyltransferase [Ignavibacteria bacterium]MBI3765222.1 RNA methyltransferase [Ignavibacteriales bacterium]
MRKLTHSEIAKQRFTFAQLHRENRFPMYALLDNIRSLYNVGSMFRTADGARFAKLFLCGYTPFPPRKEIEKTALGSTSTVPWEYQKDPLTVISTLRSQGVRICALEHTDESILYDRVSEKDFPLCVIVGNEITGVSKDLLAQTDMAIEIPMFGLKQSLNAAVAFGIAAFEFVHIVNGRSTETHSLEK